MIGGLSAEGEAHPKALLGFLWWLVVLRVPTSWHKTKGGQRYTWVGYELCLREWSLGVSASRAEWATAWMSRVLEAGMLDTAELREALGRLVFVYGALQWDKPFLAPLFFFLKLHRPGVQRKVPLYVRIVLTWLRERLVERRAHRLQSRKVIDRAVLRVDAKAEGLAVAVGGWCPFYDAEGRVVARKSSGSPLR